MSAESREFRPKKTTFLIPRITAAVLLVGFLSFGLLMTALLSESIWLVVFIPGFFLILPPAFYAANVAYGKERYEIHGDHLICHRGTIFSDSRTELDIRNITHVRLRLPWLRHRFFKTGDVRVESAGSAASEITFESIIGPEVVFEDVKDLMRSNGYSLQQSEVLHEESPGVMGAMVDIVQTLGGAAFSMLFGAFFFVGIIADIGLGGDGFVGLVVLVIGGVIGATMMLATFGGLAVRYLDLTRRTYTVYNDTVSYTEGFLTRDNAFIPYENIADASVDRTFVDQALGLYDVKVSCQGSGSEIAFRRLVRGGELREAIVSLVAAASQRVRTEQEAPAKAPKAEGADPDATEEIEAVPAAPVAAAKRKRKLVAPEDAWTADLKMHLVRSLVPLTVLILAFPAWVLAVGAMFIKATRTTYTVGPNSLSTAYSFIGSSQQDFAYDKVTGVQIDRSPFDSFFGTMTIQIWSIGSPMPLVMSHIPADQVDLPALLRQCGINDDESAGELKQSFGPKVWLIQNVFVFIFLVIVALSMLVLSFFAGPLVLLLLPFIAVIPAIMAATTYFRVQKQRLTFHSEHLEAQTGIFFRQHIYARYDNIKKVESTQIPLTDQGTFKIYIAGERIVQQQQGQEGAGIKIPYSLEGRYIHGIAHKVDALDALMLGQITADELEDYAAEGAEVLSVSKPSLANEMIIFMAVGILMPPIWFMAPIIAWQIKVRRYEVEASRVVLRGGIIFKSVTSVLFERIDSIQQHQGALGKAFGNGTITILTAGSSAPDLNVANIPDYQDVYAAIRKAYGKGKA